MSPIGDILPTSSQKAIIALDIEKYLAIEAKEREKMGKERIPDPKQLGQARDKAAQDD